VNNDLYRHYDSEGNLLYVGISLSSIRRLQQHKNNQWFNDIKIVKIEKFKNRREAEIAEKRAIAFEVPLFNKYRPSAYDVFNFMLEDAKVKSNMYIDNLWDKLISGIEERLIQKKRIEDECGFETESSVF
jgi:hypothetical protein